MPSNLVSILISVGGAVGTLSLGLYMARHTVRRDHGNDLTTENDSLRKQLEQHKDWLDQCRSEKDYLVTQLSRPKRRDYERRNGDT